MATAPNPDGTANGEWHWQPENLLRAAWNYKWLVLFGTIVGLGLSAAVGSALPRVYQSTAQIAVVKKRPDAITGLDTRHIDEGMAPPQDLLRSSLILTGAVQASHLDAVESAETAGGDLADRIRSALTVVPTKTPLLQSQVFKLSYRGPYDGNCR